MAEQPSVITKWDDFSGGDYGSLDGRKAPANSFKASNMLVYSSGGVGPRAGLKNITPTEMPDGPLLALASTPVVGKDGLFVIAERVYTFDLNTPGVAPTMIGSFAHAPNQPIVPKLDTATLLATIRYGDDLSDKTYRIDPMNGTVTGLTSSPGGHDVTLYGQMVVIADSEFSPQIQGSSPLDPNDWSEGRFAIAGDNWQVTALHTLRNALMIMKRTGIYVLSGILGDDQTQVIRTVSSVDGALHPWQTAKDQEDQVWFWSLFRKAPAMFNNATVRYFGQFKLPTRENDDTIADTPLKRGVVVIDGDLTSQTVVFVQGGDSQKAVVSHNGKWSLHDFETDVTGMLAANGSQVVTTDGGLNDEPAQIYTTVFDLDRPAFVGEEIVSPGDGGNTPLQATFSPAPYWSPGGREFTVRQVVVDFTAWNTGTSESLHFDLDVRVMGRNLKQGGDEITYSTASGGPNPYDESVSEASTTGTQKRQVFNFQCAQGAGAELTFRNIRGVRLDAIYLMGPKRDERPVTP